MCVRISSVRRVLQFTPHNAVSCVLHRSAIRVIHRLQSYRLFVTLDISNDLCVQFPKHTRPPKKTRPEISAIVRQRQRLHEPSSSGSEESKEPRELPERNKRSQLGNPLHSLSTLLDCLHSEETQNRTYSTREDQETRIDIATLATAPRTRHRTKLET